MPFCVVGLRDAWWWQIWSLGVLWRCDPVVINILNRFTFQGINISYLGKRRIIFKSAFLSGMLVPRRVEIDLIFLLILGTLWQTNLAGWKMSPDWRCISEIGNGDIPAIAMWSFTRGYFFQMGWSWNHKLEYYYVYLLIFIVQQTFLPPQSEEKSVEIVGRLLSMSRWERVLFSGSNKDYYVGTRWWRFQIFFTHRMEDGISLPTCLLNVSMYSIFFT